MKLFWLILAAAPVLALNAQTNLPAPEFSVATNAAVATASTNTPPRERPPIDIIAEHGDFDLKNRIGVYTGNVRVTDPQMKLTCEVLTASVPTNGGRMDSIVAERNVKIDGEDDKGRPVRVVSDKAVYSYKVLNSVTNETITLTGNVFVDSAMFKGTGDPLVWDRINNTIHGENMRMQIQPETKAGTNAPPAKAIE
jgi:lipopolysaccharide export system protein LptA